MSAPETATFQWTIDKIDLNRLRSLDDVRSEMGVDALVRSLLANERAIAMFDDDGSLKFLRDEIFLPGTDLGLRILKGGLKIDGKDRPLYVLGSYCLKTEVILGLFPGIERTRAKPRPSVRARRKRGPKFRKLPRVIERMRELGGYEAVRAMTEEEMVERFKASRDTCRRARDTLFAEVRTH